MIIKWTVIFYAAVLRAIGVVKKEINSLIDLRHG